MKVLHVSYGGLGNGGVSSVILSIVKSLHNEIDFGCIVFNKRGERENEFLKCGKLYRVNCYFRTSSGERFLERLLRPYRMTYAAYTICKHEHYNVIHCHNGYDEMYFLLGAKMAGVKKRVAHSHNSRSPKRLSCGRQIYNSLCRFGINILATDRIGCSQAACTDFFRKAGGKVIFNSIDLSKFYWHRVEHSNYRFVHVGRYDYQKNQSYVIDVFKIIHDSYPESELKLIGFGDDEMALKSKVGKLGLTHSIHLIDGHCCNIHQAYAEADLMIFPSFYEGFGIVLIEAQATGCYCFASDVVPDAVNIGMMTKLDLRKGPQYWADSIIDHMKRNEIYEEKDIHDRLSFFDDKFVGQQYKELYGKE